MRLAEHKLIYYDPAKLLHLNRHTRQALTPGKCDVAWAVDSPFGNPNMGTYPVIYTGCDLWLHACQLNCVHRYNEIQYQAFLFWQEILFEFTNIIQCVAALAHWLCLSKEVLWRSAYLASLFGADMQLHEVCLLLLFTKCVTTNPVCCCMIACPGLLCPVALDPYDAPHHACDSNPSSSVHAEMRRCQTVGWSLSNDMSNVLTTDMTNHDASPDERQCRRYEAC